MKGCYRTQLGVSYPLTVTPLDFPKNGMVWRVRARNSFCVAHCAALRGPLSGPLAVPQPPVGRSNRHHPIEARIGPAHTVAPAGKCQCVVFLTVANA